MQPTSTGGLWQINSFDTMHLYFRSRHLRHPVLAATRAHRHASTQTHHLHVFNQRICTLSIPLMWTCATKPPSQVSPNFSLIAATRCTSTMPTFSRHALGINHPFWCRSIVYKYYILVTVLFIRLRSPIRKKPAISLLKIKQELT